MMRDRLVLVPLSVRRCVCMLWGKWGTGAGMWVALTDICWGPVRYFLLSDDSIRFLQTPTRVHSPCRRLRIPKHQAGSQNLITSVCSLRPKRGPPYRFARSPTTRGILDFHRSPASMTFKRHYY